MKCDLVIIFNHKFERNLPLLEKLYGDRFNRIWFLMPFSQIVKENVVSVYDGSFTFQSFVAHSWNKLSQSGADLYLYISDDLILDPSLNQDNIIEALGIQSSKAFISQMIDLSTGEYGRGLIELKKSQPLDRAGLEVKGELPDFDEARKLLKRHVSLDSLVLSKYDPYKASLELPIWKNRKKNWSHIKANIWHKREQFRHFINPVEMQYPFVGGNADIFAVRRECMDNFVHYCGVFAAMRMFVELAIPTALALSCESVITEKTAPREGMNYVHAWTYSEIQRKFSFLEEFCNCCQSQISRIPQNWPSNYLYLHPLKLSKWHD